MIWVTNILILAMLIFATAMGLATALAILKAVFESLWKLARRPTSKKT